MTDETSSDTAPKLPPGKPFRKGYDPRRNLRGVPKEAIAARHFVRKIGAELIHVKEAGLEYDITRAEAMIRPMFSSKAPADKQTLIKALWPGLLKDELDITSGGKPIMSPEEIAAKVTALLAKVQERKSDAG